MNDKPLTTIQLQCGHARQVDAGTAGLVTLGRIDTLHCVVCRDVRYVVSNARPIGAEVSPTEEVTSSIVGTSSAMVGVAGEVLRERVSQEKKWGRQDHPNGTGPGPFWIGIFGGRRMEDIAEIAKLQVDHEALRGCVTYAGILAEEFFESLTEDDPAKLRAELIQVAAVAAAWVEKIDRDAARNGEQAA